MVWYGNLISYVMYVCALANVSNVVYLNSIHSTHILVTFPVFSEY